MQPKAPIALLLALCGSVAVGAGPGAIAGQEEAPFGGIPSGVLVCEGAFEGSEGLVWRTIKLAFEAYDEGPLAARKHWVGIDGLDQGSGGYLHNSTRIVIYAPQKCLLDGEDIVFRGCAFTGVVDRVDGSFTFYRGDEMNQESAFFWSQIEDGKVCSRARRAF